MKVVTKLFGEVEVEENKLLTFDSGIIGFEKLNKFMLIHEPENEGDGILWLQSIEGSEFALPVINPLYVLNEYNPVIEDELLKQLGEINDVNTLVLVTLTVPSDITKMSVNLKAPLIINTSTLKACQIIVDNELYNVKYPVYEVLRAINKKDGE